MQLDALALLLCSPPHDLPSNGQTSWGATGEVQQFLDDGTHRQARESALELVDLIILH
eukprot:SAG11_NODE_10142_length_852_cov_0.811421_1_plen_57_part_10